MNKLIIGMVLCGLTMPALGDRFDDLSQREKDTAVMLAAHTKYVYKHRIKPHHEPDELVKAMRMCIVTQMNEPGCYEILQAKPIVEVITITIEE